ncbi:MAG: hypothetical protein ACEPOZ_20130 [Marinifilaceae bacterium]
MKEKECIELMRLRVPARWAVTYNQFYDVDPISNPDSEYGMYKNWDYFTEDILQIVKTDFMDGDPGIAKNHLLIDLGYYPEGKEEGAYGLQLVFKDKEQGWLELAEFDSKDRYEIRNKMEEWMEKLILADSYEEALCYAP